jgi:hypothetical protein
MEKEGLVDEAVVMALISDTHSGRSMACPEDLALAAEDLDFAGWQLPATQAARPRAAEIPPPRDQRHRPPRRATAHLCDDNYNAPLTTIKITH